METINIDGLPLPASRIALGTWAIVAGTCEKRDCRVGLRGRLVRNRVDADGLEVRYGPFILDARDCSSGSRERCPSQAGQRRQSRTRGNRAVIRTVARGLDRRVRLRPPAQDTRERLSDVRFDAVRVMERLRVEDAVRRRGAKKRFVHGVASQAIRKLWIFELEPNAPGASESSPRRPRSVQLP
jgi:hypothetical protein